MVEILAPAGNIECLRAAVASGANAVYLGLKAFNARAKAGNFDLDQLKSAVDYCHIFNVKVYLTLNTMVKQSELPDVFELIRSAALCNIDAFIVSDLGLIGLIKRATNVPVHLSTQAGVNNLEGAMVARSLGVQRVILARETSLNEIIRIKTALPDLELECFVHGALCVGYSGQCLLSSSRNGDSGNRGRCRQLCRLKYSSSFNKKGYLLSARDICLIDQVKALLRAGISSFKIEGRLKSPEYVASVVSAYQKAVQGNLTDFDRDLMSLAYNRSNGPGYLNGENDKIIDEIIQNHRGITIGRVASVEKFYKFNKICVKLNDAVRLRPQKGDGVKITSQRGDEICGGEVSEVGENSCVIYSSIPCGVGDVASLTKSDSHFVGVMRDPKRRFSMKIYLGLDAPIRFEADSDGVAINRTTDVFCLPAMGRPLDRASIVKQMSKTGDTEFILENCEVVLEDGVFLPVSSLNELRRDLIKRLRVEILSRYSKEVDFNFVPDFSAGRAKCEGGNVCVVKSKNQISKSVLEFFDTIIFSPVEYSERVFDDFFVGLDEICSSDKINIFAEIPAILEESDVKVLYKTIEKYNTRIVGALINNLSGVEIAKNLSLDVLFGYSFNIANRLFPLEGAYVSSAELSATEHSQVGGLLFAEGSLQLMKFKHCPVKANLNNSCKNCAYTGTITYNDGKYSFPLQRIKVANCYFILYNSIRTGLSGKVDVTNGLFMDFYGYTPAEVNAVIEAYTTHRPILGRTAQFYKNGVQ